MLRRIDTLIEHKQDFGFETTMAARSHVKRLQACKAQGYTVHVLYFWLSSPELAIQRVAARVRAGGHHIPDDVVRRRYGTGLRNFFQLYQPSADSWIVFDNTGSMATEVARKSRQSGILVTDARLWSRMRAAVDE